jgi:cytochrome c1
MLSLQRHGDDGTDVEVKVAPFALPQDLKVVRDTNGLPEPDHAPSFGSTGGADSVRRKSEGITVAEIPAVLAFYRRELAARGWKEETNGAVATSAEATVNFSTAEQTATLRLGRRYDLTTVTLVAQVKESALAARAKAKKDADDNFFKDADATAKQFIAADEARQAAAASNLSDAPLHALAGQTTPVPVPETAENVQFDGADGRLEFDSSSSVKAVAAFYRGTMKSWAGKNSLR